MICFVSIINSKMSANVMNVKLVPYSLSLTRKGVANDKYVSFLISCLTRNDEYSNVSMPIPSSLLIESCLIFICQD